MVELIFLSQTTDMVEEADPESRCPSAGIEGNPEETWREFGVLMGLH